MDSGIYPADKGVGNYQRLARLVELDPLYVDVTVRRWEKLTGKKATLEGDSRCFADIAAIRAAEGQING